MPHDDTPISTLYTEISVHIDHSYYNFSTVCNVLNDVRKSYSASQTRCDLTRSGNVPAINYNEKINSERAELSEKRNTSNNYISPPPHVQPVWTEFKSLSQYYPPLHSQVFSPISLHRLICILWGSL